MKFDTALDLLKEGEKVRRWTWDKNIHLNWVKGEDIYMWVNLFKLYWIPKQEDILAEDWEIHVISDKFME